MFTKTSNDVKIKEKYITHPFREVYVKGIDASYHYEGYNVYKIEDIQSEKGIDGE